MANEGELTSQKIAAAEARGDTKIVRLEGKLEVISATILGEIRGIRDDVRQSDQYNRDTRWIMLATVITGVFALGALVVALVTYGDAVFGRGMNVRDVIQATIKETLEQTKKP